MFVLRITITKKCILPVSYYKRRVSFKKISEHKFRNTNYKSYISVEQKSLTDPLSITQLIRE